MYALPSDVQTTTSRNFRINFQGIVKAAQQHPTLFDPIYTGTDLSRFCQKQDPEEEKKPAMTYFGVGLFSHNKTLGLRLGDPVIPFDILASLSAMELTRRAGGIACNFLLLDDVQYSLPASITAEQVADTAHKKYEQVKRIVRNLGIARDTIIVRSSDLAHSPIYQDRYKTHIAHLEGLVLKQPDAFLDAGNIQYISHQTAILDTLRPYFQICKLSWAVNNKTTAPEALDVYKPQGFNERLFDAWLHILTNKSFPVVTIPAGFNLNPHHSSWANPYTVAPEQVGFRILCTPDENVALKLSNLCEGDGKRTSPYARFAQAFSQISYGLHSAFGIESCKTETPPAEEAQSIIQMLTRPAPSFDFPTFSTFVQAIQTGFTSDPTTKIIAQRLRNLGLELKR
jgi:hypothetical protein